MSTEDEFNAVIRKESLDDYLKITKPFIDVEGNAPSVQWMYDILDGTKEQEKVLHRDSDPSTGFVLLRKEAFDPEKQNELSYMAIVNRRDLKSIRDLTEAEIPLLKNLASKGKEEIAKETGLDASNIFALFDYHPEFWHLHVHYRYKLNIPNAFLEINRCIARVAPNVNYKWPEEINTHCKIPELASRLKKLTEEEQQVHKRGFEKRYLEKLKYD